MVDDEMAHVSDAAKRMVSTPALLPPPDAVANDISGYQGIAFVADRGWVTNSTTGEILRVGFGGDFHDTLVEVVRAEELAANEPVRSAQITSSRSVSTP